MSALKVSCKRVFFIGGRNRSFLSTTQFLKDNWLIILRVLVYMIPEDTKRDGSELLGPRQANNAFKQLQNA